MSTSAMARSDSLELTTFVHGHSIMWNVSIDDVVSSAHDALGLTSSRGPLCLKRHSLPRLHRPCSQKLHTRASIDRKFVSGSRSLFFVPLRCIVHAVHGLLIRVIVDSSSRRSGALGCGCVGGLLVGGPSSFLAQAIVPNHMDGTI